MNNSHELNSKQKIDMLDSFSVSLTIINSNNLEIVEALYSLLLFLKNENNFSHSHSTIYDPQCIACRIMPVWNTIECLYPQMLKKEIINSQKFINS